MRVLDRGKNTVNELCTLTEEPGITIAEDGNHSSTIGPHLEHILQERHPDMPEAE